MKKIVSIILLMGLVLCFAACSNKKPNSSSLTSGEIAYDENGNVVVGSDEDSHDHSHNTGSATASKNNNNNNNSTGSGDKSDNNSSKQTASRPKVNRPTLVVEEKENMSASVPEIAVDEGAVNKTWSIYLAPDDLRSKLNIDALSAGISVRETADGKTVASYAMIGYSEIFFDSITDAERYAIADSITYDWKLYYDANKKQGMYFSWDSKGISNEKKIWTFDDVLAKHKDKIVDDDGMIRLPSELFGKRVIYQGNYVPCKYDTKSGKLTIEGKFPFKDIYIEGAVGKGKYKIDGKVYSF